ncbi:unnamed protein product [Laminaria digitata]
MKIENAVIFDMDGIIIDSEPLWKQAEKEVFSAVGVDVKKELTAITAALTAKEVTKYWYNYMPWKNKSLDEVENEVIDLVGHLISTHGVAIKGIKELLAFFKAKGFKIGLATNAPFRLIPIVLNKIGIADYFEVISSAEFEKEGKPNPDVYLTTAYKLGIHSGKCIVFEDSSSGLNAAKIAGMKVVLLCQEEEFRKDKYKMLLFGIK